MESKRHPDLLPEPEDSIEELSVEEMRQRVREARDRAGLCRCPGCCPNRDVPCESKADEEDLLCSPCQQYQDNPRTSMGHCHIFGSAPIYQDRPRPRPRPAWQEKPLLSEEQAREVVDRLPDFKLELRGIIEP